MTTTGRFVEVADRVLVLREPVLAVNVTLVLGDGAALLVDTLSTAGQRPNWPPPYGRSPPTR